MAYKHNQFDYEIYNAFDHFLAVALAPALGPFCCLFCLAWIFLSSSIFCFI